MIERVRGAQLLTGDTRMTADEERWLMSAGPLRPITKAELYKLVERAAEVKASFDVIAIAGMTTVRALRIKDLRANASWRTLAAICHVEWGEDALWAPESNQLAGMALCEAAALKLGEDPQRPPWQSVS